MSNARAEVQYRVAQKKGTQEVRHENRLLQKKGTQILGPFFLEQSIFFDESKFSGALFFGTVDFWVSFFWVTCEVFISHECASRVTM